MEMIVGILLMRLRWILFLLNRSFLFIRFILIMLLLAGYGWYGVLVYCSIISILIQKSSTGHCIVNSALLRIVSTFLNRQSLIRSTAQNYFKICRSSNSTRI